jgi:AcrR family transcriptional regulator
MTVSGRREREQNMRYEMILEAASQLFREKGFETTTVDEIAALAELGKGTIYSYFKSKDQIYIAILEKGLEAFQARIDLVIQSPTSAIDALFQMYDIFIQYHNERSGLVEALFMQADPKVSLRLGELVHGLKDKASHWTDSVRQLLVLGISNGELTPCDAERTAQLIIGMILGIIMQLEMGQNVGDLKNYREPLSKILLAGLERS